MSNEHDSAAAEPRLAVIGAGNLSSKRIFPCLRFLRAELAAVCDLDQDLAAKVARQYGARESYVDYRDMLDKAAPDAVIVCVSPTEHARLAIDIVESGLPVYTEKPPAVSATAAREVWEASVQAGVPCMTGFKKRFAPAYRKLAGALHDDQMGELSLLSIDYASGSYHEDPANPRSQFLGSPDPSVGG